MNKWTNLMSERQTPFKTELWKLTVSDQAFVFATRHKPMGHHEAGWDVQLVFFDRRAPASMPDVFVVKGDHRDAITSMDEQELRRWANDHKPQANTVK